VIGKKALERWNKAGQESVWNTEKVSDIKEAWDHKPKQTLKMHTACYYILGDSILDVGCGTGDLLDALRCHRYEGTYLGVDQSKDMLKQARRLHPDNIFTKANLYDMDHIPLADTVICLDVLHHQESLDPGFNNLYRKARKRLIITLWINDRDTHHEPQTKGRYGEWLTYYTQQELKERFKDLKYSVIREVGCPWKDMYLFRVN